MARLEGLFGLSSAIAPALLYYLHPYRHALTPSGPSTKGVDVKNRSRRFFIPGFLPYALRAILRTFKFTPDEFVEPYDETTLPNGEQ